MEGEPGEIPAGEPGAVPPVLSYATPGRSRLVTVASYTQVFEADLARLKLEGEGISTVLANDNFAALLGSGVAGMGGAQIQVNEDDAARARAILDDVEAMRRERARRREPAAGEATCPRCGGTDVARRPVSPGAIAWVLAIVGAFALAADWRYAAGAWAAAVVLLFVAGWEEFRCRSCGCAWSEQSGDDDADDAEGEEGEAKQTRGQETGQDSTDGD